VQTEVKESGRFERTLTVRIENDELAAAKKTAAAKISRSMKIKGFRPGKAPLAIVERMAGADYVRSEAIDEAIQDAVPAAIDEAGLEPVTVPSVTEIRDESEDGYVEIDVTITLWPELDALPDLGEFEIEVEDPAVTQEEIDEQLDALRNQFAELEDYEGELSDGDFAMIDVSVSQDGASIDEAAAKDMMYEVGSESFIEGIDALLVGAEAGATVSGGATLPDGYTDHGGEEVTLELTITEAKKKVLPELTDEMVSDATEFETVEELLAALDKNMLAYKVHTQRQLLQDKVVQYVLNEIDLDVPAALIDAEVQARVRNLESRLEGDDISIENYLEIIGQSDEEFVASLRDQADHALSTRVLLESIAAIENYEVTDDDLRDHIEHMLQGQEADVDELVEAWKSSGQIESLTSDILRERALANLIESAKPVDEDGNPVDLTPVVIDEPDQEPEEDTDEAAEEDESVDSADESPEASEVSEDATEESEN
jgi:trigger factor